MNDAYTAGIIDGDGTITIANQDGYYYVRVNVTMSDKGYRVLDFLHREYGGMMGKERPASGNTRASKQWRVSNGDAARVINAVLNHLQLKREQALVALQLWDLIEEAPKKPNGRTEWSDSMKASAEVLKRRMNELNARGVRGPEPQEIREGAVAVWKYGEWYEPENDLFGPVPFRGKLPVSGSMRNGVAYELPTSAPRMDASGSLFSQLGGKLLTTPTTTQRGTDANLETRYGARANLHNEVIDLLPTPRSNEANGIGTHGDGGDDLRTTISLLPTPKAGDADFGMPRTSGRPPEKSTHLMTRMVHTVPKLLPTPNTMEHLPARTGEARERQLRRGEGPDASRRESMGNLREDIVEVPEGSWGPYASAIARWEDVIGRPAPDPTEVGPKGGRRLSAAFVEWMMGLPAGWVTGRGLPRTAELKMLGNGVVTQQALAALRLM